jgi:hypothetical protein
MKPTTPLKILTIKTPDFTKKRGINILLRAFDELGYTDVQRKWLLKTVERRANVWQYHKEGKTGPEILTLLLKAKYPKKKPKPQSQIPSPKPIPSPPKPIAPPQKSIETVTQPTFNNNVKPVVNFTKDDENKRLQKVFDEFNYTDEQRQWLLKVDYRKKYVWKSYQGGATGVEILRTLRYKAT